MKTSKSPYMEATDRRIEQLESDNEALLHAVAELQQQNINLFKMHCHFMAMMAVELASVRTPQGRPAHKAVTPAPDATHGKDC